MSKPMTLQELYDQVEPEHRNQPINVTVSDQFGNRTTVDGPEDLWSVSRSAHSFCFDVSLNADYSLRKVKSK